MKRRNLISGIASGLLLLPTHSFGKFDSRLASIVNNLDNFVLTETTIGEELRNINLENKVDYIQINQVQSESRINYFPIDNKIVASPIDYKRELSHYSSLVNNTRIFELGHEYMHSIQKFYSKFHSFEEFQKMWKNPEKEYFTKNDENYYKRLINERENISFTDFDLIVDHMNELKNDYFYNYNSRWFLNELYSYILDGNNITKSPFKDSFLNAYSQYQDFENSYDGISSNLESLYGILGPVKGSIYLSKNNTNLNDFNEQFHYDFTTEKIYSGNNKLNNRNKIINEEYRVINDYARKLTKHIV